MLYREVFAVYSEIHTKHINTLCGQNVEFLIVKLVVYIVTLGSLVVRTLTRSIVTAIDDKPRHACNLCRCLP